MTFGFTPFASNEVPTEFSAHVSAPVEIGPGCDVRPSSNGPPFVEVFCPLRVPVERRSLRYRLTLDDGADHVFVFPSRGYLRGVVYAGAGKDDIRGHRVYGGSGNDELIGTTVYGGPGNDSLAGAVPRQARSILRGGRGDDHLFGAPRLYGGRGDDYLEAAPRTGPPGVADMLVGGPGHDSVEITDGSEAAVVRLRGGGADSVFCYFSHAAAQVVMFVDRADRLDAQCSRARILYDERPRAPGAARSREPRA